MRVVLVGAGAGVRVLVMRRRLGGQGPSLRPWEERRGTSPHLRTILSTPTCVLSPLSVLFAPSLTSRLENRCTPQASPKQSSRTPSPPPRPARTPHLDSPSSRTARTLASEGTRLRARVRARGMRAGSGGLEEGREGVEGREWGVVGLLLGGRGRIFSCASSFGCYSCTLLPYPLSLNSLSLSPFNCGRHLVVLPYFSLVGVLLLLREGTTLRGRNSPISISSKWEGAKLRSTHGKLFRMSPLREVVNLDSLRY